MVSKGAQRNQAHIKDEQEGLSGTMTASITGDSVKDNRKLTKNEKRRIKNKMPKGSADPAPIQTSNSVYDDLNVAIEYVDADVNKEISNSGLESYLIDEFKEIFEKFSSKNNTANISALTLSSNSAGITSEGKAAALDDNDNEASGSAVQLSKKKLKLLSRFSVAELKQLVSRPDVVEAHDVTAQDPKLLVFLKAYRSTVPVPRHWCHKRKYLQGKRGIEKPPFALPEFIAETGITKIRDSLLELEAIKKSRAKARDRVLPKMGKIDIDYQVLHDAFFKFQTKPKLSVMGDLYYEGKEFEVSLSSKKPGKLSADLMTALGMVETTLGTTPPPWLLNMQRYGPPPSYPSLKVPGLNSPIPTGASFGYAPGQWGKPPVDEHGRPLYGDVFGLLSGVSDISDDLDKKSRWGEVTIFEEEGVEEDEEEDEEEEDEDGETASGMATPSTLDGMSSVVTGLQTPDTIDLRKRGGAETPQEGARPVKELYTVLSEKNQSIQSQFFGTDRTYALPAAGEEDVSDSAQVSESEKEGKRSSTTGKRKERVESAANASVKRAKEFKF